MLSCLGAEERSYEKEEMIYRAGNTVTSLGVVMHGSVMIVNDDLWGNRSILDRVEPGQIFAETYACVPGEKLLVDVFAAEVTEVLFLKCWKNAVAVSQFLRTSHAAYPQSACNLGAEKLAAVPPDLQYIVEIHPGTASVVPLRSRRSKNESERFDIPFNRQQLADYLGVDRSALSAELGKMQREGLLEFRKKSLSFI